MGRLIFIISVVLLFQAIGFGQETEKVNSVITKPSHVYRIYWFSNNLSLSEEKKWLTDISNEVKEKPNSKLYLIINTKKPKSKKNQIRQQRIRNFLINDRKLNKEFVKFIYIEADSEETQYFVVPEGANPPNN